MPSTNQILSDLRVRLNTHQPIVWVETDEPNRAAKVIREYIVGYSSDYFKKVGTERAVYEYDLTSGLSQITRDGELIRRRVPGVDGEKEVIGMPVDFCNPEPPGAPKGGSASQPMPKNNIDPTRPWRFIIDMIENVPAGGIVIVHNFAEVVDLALKSPYPHACPLMRNAFLQLTGTMAASSTALPFNNTNRMLVATGRLPDPVIARTEILDTIDLLTLDRPTDVELRELLSRTLDSVGDQVRGEIIARNAVTYNTEDENGQIDRAALNLKGLSHFAAETAAVRTINATRHFDPATLTRQRKNLVERMPGLTLIEPAPSKAWSRVKGLENIETFAHKSILEVKNPKLRVNSMTVIGPQGVGKSMCAHGLAQLLGVPLIVCNLGLVFSKYIGDSQHAMKALIDTLDALGYCVVLFDEADKQLDGLISDGGSRGDGGVGSQVMSMLLTWENDRTEKPNGPIVMRTANRVSNLKGESLRAGRNDVTFYVDFPHIGARRDIIEMYLRDYDVEPTEEVVNRLAEDTKMWSGAELKELAKNVARFGDKEAFKFVRPIYRAKEDEIKKLRAEAKDAGIPASASSVDDEDEESIRASAKRATSPRGRLESTGRSVASV